MRENIKSIIIDFSKFLQDKNKKPFYKIIYELIKCTLQEKTIPYYYLTKFLYRRSNGNYFDYISHKRATKLKFKLNDSIHIPILENKLTFQDYFTKHDIPLPKILAYNFKKYFFISEKRFYVESYDSFKEILNIIIDKSNSNSIFLKTIIGLGGKNAYKIDREDLNSSNIKIREIFNKINSYDYIFQETVKQHHKLSEVNSSSANTIRFNTFVNDEGVVEIISALMRFGTNGGIVDNASGGGIMVGVDLDKGILLNNGFTPLKLGGKEYKNHPNTGLVLEGFKIPYIQKAKELVISAGSCVPTLRLVGWDIGITNSGPILIEGNAHFHIGNADIADGGLRKNLIFSRILEEYA